jgi:hypothetical protein
MLLTAGKYSDVRSAGGSPAPLRKTAAGGPPALLIPTAKARKSWVDLRDWIWREFKDGGFLKTYLSREKNQSKDRIRAIGRLMHGFTQNNKSDFQRKADIPAREYHRWKSEDEHFFDDDNNLRSLKRDNPDLPIYVGPRAMPSTVQRKTYTNPPSPSYGAASQNQTQEPK